MNDVATVRARKYVRLGRITFAVVEPAYEFLLKDVNFVEKVKIAYMVQVEYNHGCGFTVYQKGYVVRFDLPNMTGYQLQTIYEGYVLEEPRTVQTSLIEVIG